MKKYLWIVALIAALAMVFVGCGDGDDSGGTGDDVTITFDMNAAGYTGPSLTAPDAQKIKKGAAIGALPAAPDGTADYGYLFTGWFLAAEGGSAISATTTFSADAKVYAQWATFNPDTEVAIIFKLNYDGAPEDTVVIGTVGEALGTKWPADPTRPGTVEGQDTPNDVWAFKGWKQYDVGTGTTYTDATELPGTIINNTVYAYWEPATGFPPDTPPANVNLAGSEKITLQNGCEAAYQFVIPADKTWADYSGMSADYIVGPKSWALAGRPHRLMGNYELGNFSTFVVPDDSSSSLPNGFLAANINGGFNAPYMINQPHAGWDGVGTTLAALGIAASPWEWFTLTYDISGTKGNAAFEQKNVPADSAKGPFYFALGFSAGSAPGTTQWIKNVKLIGNTGTADVVATPLYIKDGANVYPAFVAYDTATGNGTEVLFRAMADGSTPPTVDKP
jgi:hypothetical protein